MENDVIRFTAQVSQVRTLADGGLRFVLDVAESEIEAATKLMQVKQGGGLLDIGAIPIIVKQQDTTYAIQTRSKRKSQWTPAEVQSVNSNT
jgi:uncharacterized membrane protein